MTGVLRFLAQRVVAQLRARGRVVRWAGECRGRIRARFGAVVHAVTPESFDGREAHRMADTIQTLATTASAAGVRSFVLGSTTLVYQGSDTTIDADTPPLPSLPFGEAMLEVERRVARIGEDSGMAVAIMRLPHVYGAGSPLFDYVEAGSIPVAGGTDAVFSHLHVDDAGAALAAAADLSLHGTFVVADTSPVTWDHFLDVVKAHRPDLAVIRPTAEEETRAMLLSDHRAVVPSMLMPGTGLGFRLDQRIDAAGSWRRLGRTPMYGSIRSGIPAALGREVPGYGVAV